MKVISAQVTVLQHKQPNLGLFEVSVHMCKLSCVTAHTMCDIDPPTHDGHRDYSYLYYNTGSTQVVSVCTCTIKAKLKHCGVQNKYIAYKQVGNRYIQYSNSQVYSVEAANTVRSKLAI